MWLGMSCELSQKGGATGRCLKQSFNSKAIKLPYSHIRLVELYIVAPAAFSEIHSGVSALGQQFFIVAVLWINGDTNAG